VWDGEQAGMGKSTVDRIRLCEDCRANIQVLCTKPKPYVEFDVIEKWKPAKVKALFIAESPPKDGDDCYFYNEKMEGKLKNKIFNLLDLDELNVKKALEKFKERNFCLVDVVKCRLDKSRRKSVSEKVIRRCAENFLIQEIEDLKPDTICVLGGTALKGLKALTTFRKGLANIKKITEHCGKELTIAGYEIVLCVFPNNRNFRKFKSCIESVFDLLSSTQLSNEGRPDYHL